MQSLIENVKPEYIVNKKAVILSIREYESIIEWIEDMEDANDLLRAEREADSFVPYDKFRSDWINR